MTIYDATAVRLGTIGQDARETMAKRALSHARHFGRVMVCRDHLGAVWSVWPGCRQARKVLAEMPQSVVGTFAPQTYHFAKICRRFVADVVEALT